MEQETKILKSLGNDFYLANYNDGNYNDVYYVGKKENFIKSLIDNRAYYNVIRANNLYIVDQITKIKGNSYIIGNNRELVKELIIPKDVSERELFNIIGYNCNIFDKIDLSNTEITDLPRLSCSKFKEIILPETLEHLGDRAFESCEKLESIKIPKNVKKIDEGCFRDCISLKEVDLGNVESIGWYAFYDCKLLAHIEFPNTLKNIGVSAFEWCGLTSIEIPNTVKHVMSNAFSSCYSLGYIVLPSKKNTKYGNYILAHDNDLTIIYDGPLLDFLLFMRNVNSSWKVICLNDNPDEMPSNVMKVNEIDKDNINVLLQLMESGGLWK